MSFQHLTTSAKGYSGIQMRLSLEGDNIASRRALLRALEEFAEKAKGYILQKLADDWVIRNNLYERLSYDLRGPHGSKFSLRIPPGARPIRPEDYLLLVDELRQLIHKNV